VVFKAVEAAGCRLRFIDVDPVTSCLAPDDLAAKRADVDCVIAVHMFGHVCDLGRLRAAVPGVPIIEDCAQALGSRFAGGPAGSSGEIAVFSFHSGKYLSVGEGGALRCTAPELRARLFDLVESLPRPGLVAECVHVAATFVRSSLRSRPLWGLVGARLWETYSGTVAYTSQSPVEIAQIFETDRAATLRRLPSLEDWVTRQRAHADLYLARLTVSPEMLPQEVPPAFYNRLQFPLLMPTSTQCGAMVASLRAQGISTARPYRNIAAMAAAHHGYTGDCPNAERVADTVMVIPCNHSLSTRDIEHVAASVNRAWRTIGREPAGLAAAHSTPDETTLS
jgi:dTDP-4-amino-4,6-dideoxygalactose transaminase